LCQEKRGILDHEKHKNLSTDGLTDKRINPSASYPEAAIYSEILKTLQVITFSFQLKKEAIVGLGERNEPPNGMRFTDN
jgi:hypothetical protein